MDAWELLWKILLIVGLAIFGGLAVWVTVFGARDIGKLIRTIEKQHRGPTKP